MHLDRFAARTDDRRVQRLVQILFRLGDVIVKLTGNRRPQTVNDPQHDIAVARVGNDDPNRANIVNLIKVSTLAHHFVVDAVNVLGASGDFERKNIFVREAGAQNLNRLGNVRFLVGVIFAQEIGDFGELVQFEVF